MLILTRRSSEELVIDVGIRIQVLRTSANRVTLGVQAPVGMPIQRQEHWDRATLDRTALDCGPVLVSEVEAVAH